MTTSILANPGLARKRVLNPKTSGDLAMYGVVIIWAGFALTLRAIGASPLARADVALLRFSVPAVLLLPFLPSRLARMKRLRAPDVIMVLLGGMPFFFVASEGARTTSAAHVGALIAGTAPLSVAIIGRLLERRAIPRRQWLSLSLIIAGALGMVAARSGDRIAGALPGIGLLGAASLLWGTYTIGIRRTGLDAIGNALVLAIGSLVMVVILMLAGIEPSRIGSFSFAEALPFILVQGFGVGLLATLGYAFAISRLGSTRSATIGSLAPPLAAILAVPILGESLGAATAASIAVITTGVILASRAAR
jgi:drug/metabolite transporter (DMT)-like permease